ncbi:Response regulator receiver domain-containing protein [Nakamurella panacisegetis]|uniref:Response regulator receiver domain-containing protein n=1 Tax=Nakamurella panacisegetis TaxID=1090615 RepID=A0A1H0IR49_9ACTN|nr:response regulator [Nakamurella panacisegetis]SDO33924.1 Response regulator receiver domain-containing protein [Nakamurella panacisegetis]
MTVSRTSSDAPFPVGGPERAPDATPPTVLIVDDEPDQLQLLSTYFQRAGCLVVPAIDAEHALNLPPGTRPELMVLDLRLPGIDGWELTERLRTLYPGCPIAITSVLDAADYPAAESVMPKPVTARDVRTLLRAAFPGRVR